MQQGFHPSASHEKEGPDLHTNDRAHAHIAGMVRDASRKDLILRNTYLRNRRSGGDRVGILVGG